MCETVNEFCLFHSLRLRCLKKTGRLPDTALVAVSFRRVTRHNTGVARIDDNRYLVRQGGHLTVKLSHDYATTLDECSVLVITPPGHFGIYQRLICCWRRCCLSFPPNLGHRRTDILSNNTDTSLPHYLT